MNNRPRRKQNAIWRELDGETAIISSDNKNLHMLNEVGARIWSLLDGEHDLPAIVAVVAAEYQETHESVLRDVSEYLGQLQQLKLLEE